MNAIASRRILSFIVGLVITTSTLTFAEDNIIVKSSAVFPEGMGYVFSCKSKNQALNDELSCHMPNEYRTKQIMFYAVANVPFYPAVCVDTVVKNIAPAASHVEYLWMGQCKVHAALRFAGDSYFPPTESRVDFKGNSTDYSLTVNDRVLFNLKLPPLSSPGYTKLESKEGETLLSSHIHCFGPNVNAENVSDTVCEESHKHNFMSLRLAAGTKVYVHRVGNRDLYISDDLSKTFGLKSSFTEDALVEGSCAVMFWRSPPGTISHRVGEVKKNITNLHLASFSDYANTVKDLPNPYLGLSAAGLGMENVTYDVGKILYDYVEASSFPLASRSSNAFLPVLVPPVVAIVFFH